jgi:predicted ATPase
MIRIKSIQASGVAPFKDDFSLEFKAKKKEDLADIHIFTGSNGTGKSTLLNMLTVYQNKEFIRNHIKDTNKGCSVCLIVQHDGNSYDFKSDVIGGISGWGHSPSYSEVLNKYFHYGEIYNQSFHNSNQEIEFAAFAYSAYRDLDRGSIQGIKEPAGNPLQHALDFTYKIAASNFNQWVANNKAKYAFAITKGLSEEAEEYSLAIERVQTIVAEVTNQKIRFELETNPFDVLIYVDEVPMNFLMLSDGQKSIISWIGDLLMRLESVKWVNNIPVFKRNFMLFLDEIEVHLHPAWQRRILPVIQKNFPNAQIFVSTHSPFVVGSVDDAWIYKFKKDGTYSVLDGEPVLSEDSSSYRQILRNVFDIKEQFGVAIEKKLERFYELNTAILKNERSFEDAEFQQLIDDFENNESIEVQNIIGMELKQMKRILGINEAAV